MTSSENGEQEWSDEWSFYYFTTPNNTDAIEHGHSIINALINADLLENINNKYKSESL